MERTTPVRKSHTSTADLLVWRENPPSDPSAESEPRPVARSHQPSDEISKVVFGGQLTAEEAESLQKRKQCSGSKWKEMTGSGIFSTDGEDGIDESAFSTPNNKSGLRLHQQAGSAISQISFSTDESISPKKPVSLAEVAKQRELGGNLKSESEIKMQKQLSNAKCKELSGHDIFGPPPEVPVRSLAPRNLDRKETEDLITRSQNTPGKVSNPAGGGPGSLMFSEEAGTKTARKIYDKKFAELSGNDIFKGDAPSGSAEKSLSVAKLREMSGSDIFADGKAASRDYLGGVRKPPGGESSIALV